MRFLGIVKINTTLIIGRQFFDESPDYRSANYKESSYTDLRVSDVERNEVWRGPNLSSYHIALIGFRLVLKPHPFTPFWLAPLYPHELLSAVAVSIFLFQVPRQQGNRADVPGHRLARLITTSHVNELANLNSSPSFADPSPPLSASRD